MPCREFHGIQLDRKYMNLSMSFSPAVNDHRKKRERFGEDLHSGTVEDSGFGRRA
jgi:hypothetical protein